MPSHSDTVSSSVHSKIVSGDIDGLIRAYRPGTLSELSPEAKQAVARLIRVQECRAFRLAAMHDQTETLRALDAMAREALGPEDGKVLLAEAMRAWDCGAFRVAAERGHAETLRALGVMTRQALGPEGGKALLAEAMRAWDCGAFRVAAERGHTETLQVLNAMARDAFGPEGGKALLAEMLRAQNFEGFRGAVARGHTETLKALEAMAREALGPEGGKDLLAEMMRARDCEAFREAAAWGRTEILKPLEAMAREALGPEGGKDLLAEMMRARDCEAFREAAAWGRTEMLKPLEAMAREVLGREGGKDLFAEMMRARECAAFREAAAWGHAEALKALDAMAREALGPEGGKALLAESMRARDCEAFRRAAGNKHTETANFLISHPQAPLALRERAQEAGDHAERIALERFGGLFQGTQRPESLGREGEAWNYGALKDVHDKFERLARDVPVDMRRMVLNHWKEGARAAPGHEVNWGSLSQAMQEAGFKEIDEIRDTARRMGRYVAAYILADEYRRQGRLQELAQLDGSQLEAQLAPVAQNVTKYFLERQSLPQLAGMSEQWHKLRASLVKTSNDKSTLRDFAEEGSWYPVTKKEIPVTAQGLEGYSIVNLTGAAELDEEGVVLKHCVSDYVLRCKQGYQVFSIRKDGKPQTTMGFEVEGGKLRLHQNLGYKNRAANAAEKQAQEWFLQGIGDGSIPPNVSRVGEIPVPKTRSAFENEVGVLLKDLTPERIDANLARITGMHHRRGTYMFGEENKSASITEFITNMERPRPECTHFRPEGPADKPPTEKDAAKLYYRHIREYFEKKYASEPGGKQIVEDMVDHIYQGDRLMPGVMRAPIQTRASESGKTVLRWIENPEAVCLLGIVSEHGRLPRQDIPFARKMIDHFADALATGKRLRTMPNENSRPLLDRLEATLQKRGLEMRSKTMPPRELFGSETGTPLEITAHGPRTLQTRELGSQPMGHR